jgi:DNA-binding CsgD family transcriptional regulator
MKTNPALISCYEDFLDLCSTFRLPAGNHTIENLQVFERPGVLEQLPFGSSLIDYTSGQYLYLSHNTEEILSYSKEDYLHGIYFQYNNMLPEDRQVFSKIMFPDILRFLMSIPRKDYELYRFSFTYRYYRKDGCIANLLQHSTYFEPGPDGNPLLNRVVFSDITYFKSDCRMSLTISYLTKDKGYIAIYKKRYNPLAKTFISDRELEILKLSLKGLSSKLIAEKLFISIHTVKNHKRNMMERTASRNISELINFALKNRLLV